MIKIFKNIAILEGISYLILFVNMLLMKPFYFSLYKILLYPIGMTHGILFISYFALAIFLKNSQKWDLKQFLIILAASLLPFATFFIEKKYFRNV